jgi:hypothetical protein
MFKIVANPDPLHLAGSGNLREPGPDPAEKYFIDSKVVMETSSNENIFETLF